jgi:hypothetical protein
MVIILSYSLPIAGTTNLGRKIIYSETSLFTGECPDFGILKSELSPWLLGN